VQFVDGLSTRFLVFRACPADGVPMHSTDVVSEPTATTLQQLVVRRLHELGDQTGPMSAREAANRSRGNVSYETLRHMARGEHSGQITDRVAQGLAFALDVPLSSIYEVTSTPQPKTKWVLPARFDRLNPAQRKIVEAVAAAMLDAYDRGLRDGSN
jgi:hypothetical protein